MNHEDILQNRATQNKKEGHKEVICESCGEELVFGMKDQHREFSLGLRSVLECLKIAEQEGCVPQLPAQWWADVACRHGLYLYGEAEE